MEESLVKTTVTVTLENDATMKHGAGSVPPTLTGLHRSAEGAILGDVHVLGPVYVPV